MKLDVKKILLPRLLGQRRLKGVYAAGTAGRAAEDGVDIQAGTVGHFTKGESALFTHDFCFSRFWGQKRTVNRPAGATHSLLVLDILFFQAASVRRRADFTPFHAVPPSLTPP